VLADADRKKRTDSILGDEVDRALCRAATAAVRATAVSCRLEDAEGTGDLVRVISEFSAVPAVPGTVLEWL
jgi:hypothetical protein